jgi:hypothetical protein
MKKKNLPPKKNYEVVLSAFVRAGKARRVEGGWGRNQFEFFERTPPHKNDHMVVFMWRCVLDEVRMYFGQNPQDFDE